MACSKAACPGVAFGREVPLLSRVTQGCQPLSKPRRVTAVEGNLVLTLDGVPALPLWLAELGVNLSDVPKVVAALRRTLVGLTDEGDEALARGGQFGADTRVRHLIGLDPARQGIAVADLVEPGAQLAFCTRDVEAARRDLVRVCSELREEAESGACRNRGRTATHRGRDLRVVHRPRRRTLRRAIGRVADGAARVGRRAVGGLLRCRRDRAPPLVRLHRRPDSLPRLALGSRSAVAHTLQCRHDSADVRVCDRRSRRARATSVRRSGGTGRRVAPACAAVASRGHGAL